MVAMICTLQQTLLRDTEREKEREIGEESRWFEEANGRVEEGSHVMMEK